MAQDINIKMTLTDGGTVEARVTDAKKLNSELSKVEATTERINKANSRPKSASMALERSGVDPKSLTEYNSGTTSFRGGSGGSREFAAQAQGLGGLVRLYATFAANIFAVTTAYNALSNAFKTEKMIQAAERFSSTVGTSMKSVAKDLQEATQYSLSFADSVKFANVGTAAGLAAKDIKNLTVIAKGAATALGRDVGESIQRIIQGTAKQEQEILDELGIFIKSKKAFEEYAAARNMKADDLTATQRTLAYAEAVAKAGEKWKEFADIEDPFGKLTATLQNSLTTTLNKVNEFLTPFVKLLAESGNAVIALGGLIVTMLGKRALPELKDGILNLLTFDKSRAKAAADALKVTIGSELSAVKKEAEAATKQLDTLSKTFIDYSEKSAKNTAVKGLIPSDMVQNGKTPGLSAPQLATELFKGEGLEKYKTLADVNKSVEASLAAQLKTTKNKEALMDSLIAKGVIEKTSTEQSLILTQKTIENNKQILAWAQARTKEELAVAAAHEKQETLLQRQAVLEKQLANAGGERAARVTSSDILSAAKGAAAAAPQIALQAASLKSTANDVADATKIAAGSMLNASTGFKTSFNAVGEALAKGRVAAAADGMGIAAGFKLAGSTVSALGSTLMGLPAQFSAASGAAAKFGAAGAAAGTLAAGGLSLVRQGLSGIMAALGPLMLAWSVWELAGPWIKETFFGISQELEKLKDNAKEATKQVTESINVAAKTFERANLVINARDTGAAEMVKAMEAKSNALRTLIEALEKEQNAKDAVSGYTPNKATKAGIILDKEAVAVLDKAKALSVVLKEVGGQDSNLARINEEIAVITKTLEGTSNSEVTIRTLNQRLKDLSNTANQIGNLTNLKQALFVSDKDVSQVNKMITGFKSLSELVTDSNLLQEAEARSAGFGTKVKEFAQFKSFKESAESLGKFAQTLQPIANKAEDAALAISNLGKAAKLSGVSTAAINPALEASNKLLANNVKLLELRTAATLASNGGDIAMIGVLANRAAKIQEENEVIARDLANTLANPKIVAGVGAISAALSNAKKETEQYTQASKNWFKELEQQIKLAETTLKALNATYEVNNKLLGLRANYTNQQNLENKLSTDRLKILQQEYDIEAKKAFLAKIKVTESKEGKANSAVRKEAEDNYQDTLLALGATKTQKELLLSIEMIEKNRGESLRLIEEKAKLAADATDRQLGLAKAQLDIDKAYGEAKAVALNLTQEEARYEALLLEQQGKRLEGAARLAAIERERQASVDRVNAGASAEVEATKAKFVSSAGQGPVDQRAMNEALAQVEAARVKQVEKINEEAKRKTEYDSQQLSAAEKLMSVEERRLALMAEQASQSQKLAKFANSIMGAFKGTGMEKQAKALTDVLKISQTNAQKMAKVDQEDRLRKEKNAAKLKELAEKSKSGVLANIEEEAEFKKQIAKDDVRYANERRDMELDATAESLSAFKGMFSEKTVAYKVLNGIERAIHTFRMVSTAAELAATLASVGPRVAAEGAVNSVKGAGAILSALGAPWPIGFAAGAAMAVLVASILGGGGKKVSIPGGMSAKDRQETQGTGMSWVNGQKVENGNGVFGDPTAKSESITRSLEIIADNTIEGLVYDRKMLKALEGLASAIGNTAKTLFSIQGIRTGSAFGTPESSISNSGIKGLFGSSTSKDIVDSGIKISGMFADLAKGMGQFSQYETIQTTKKRSGLLGIGGSTSISYETKSKELDNAVTKSISEIFANATKLFTEVGLKVGSSVETTLSKLTSLNVDFEASLKGLTGKELEEALNATISQALDMASNTLFGDQFKKFQEFGEGLLETVVRVVDSNDKVKLAFSSIGKTLETFSFEASEALLKAVGGIEQFTEQMEFFRENFTTEAERLATTQAGVTKVMTELGYSTVDTRAEFKALVASIDVTSSAGQALYAALMDIAPAFATVTEAHQRLLEDYAEAENELLSLMRDNSKAKELLLARETVGMNDVTKAQFLRNKAIQEEIKATEKHYELLDELDELILTSAQLREKERSSVAESNLALYDLVQAYKTKQKAEEDMISSMATLTGTISGLKDRVRSSAAAIQSAMDSLVSGFTGAQSNLTSAREALAAARETLVSNYFGSKKGLEDARKGTETALENITKGYLNAKKNVESAQKGISSSLRNIGSSIKDFLTSLMTSDLSALDPRAKVDALRSQFDSLYTKALGGDNAAAEKLQSVASELLNASKETASSSEDYSRLFGDVANKLNNVSTGLLTLAGPMADEDSAQTAALKALADAQAELARWQDAVNASGAATTIAETGLLTEWTRAKEAEEKANVTFMQWSKAVSDALGFVPTQETDKTGQDIAKSIEAFYKAQKDVNLAEKDLAAYQAALLRVGVTDLSNLKDTSNSTEKKIEEYVKAWTDARAENADASSKLLEAERLLGTITLTQLDELRDFRAAIALYNESSEAYRKADDIIKNTSLDNIKLAVASAQNAIVDAINEAAKTAVKVTEDSPTVKIPEKDIPPVQRQSAIEELGKTISDSVTTGLGGEYIGIYDYLKNMDSKQFYGDVPQFASGGDHLGGYRIVGENGPELEATGPSRIFDANDTRKILSGNNNDAMLAVVVAELRAVKSELANLRVSTSQVETNTRKAKDILENVTQGGDTIKTETA